MLALAVLGTTYVICHSLVFLEAMDWYIHHTYVAVLGSMYLIEVLYTGVSICLRHIAKSVILYLSATNMRLLRTNYNRYFQNQFKCI